MEQKGIRFSLWVSIAFSIIVVAELGALMLMAISASDHYQERIQAFPGYQQTR